MRHFILIAAAAIALSACSSSSPSSSAAAPAPASAAAAAGPLAVLHAGDRGLLRFDAGAYRVAWDLGSCTSYAVEIAPTDGSAPIRVPVAGAAGSAIVQLPAGSAYVNRSGVCPGQAGATITVSRP